MVVLGELLRWWASVVFWQIVLIVVTKAFGGGGQDALANVALTAGVALIDTARFFGARFIGGASGYFGELIVLKKLSDSQVQKLTKTNSSFDAGDAGTPPRYVHTPVLLDECLDSFEPLAVGSGDPWMIDATVGEGGHSEAFLTRYPKLHILAIDADKEILARARFRLERFGERVQFFNGWSKDFFQREVALYPKPCFILFDLGVSVFHYTKAHRGFSFMEEEPLDMRLSPDTQSVSAATIINETGAEELADILFKNADERRSRSIAKAIIVAREKKPIATAKELAQIVYNAVPEKLRHTPTHPATKTFMALRIAVNGELEWPKETLYNAFNALEVGGRLAVISFHSKEDAIVKRYFRNLGKNCVCPPNIAKCVCGGVAAGKVLTKKAIKPSDNEVEKNNPSRSAQLRVVQKIHDAISYHLLGVEG